MSELPPNWALARVGDLVELGPKNDCPDDTEVGFVPLQRLGVDYRSRHTFEPKPWSAVKKGYTHFADGDVLLARITPSNCHVFRVAGTRRKLVKLQSEDKRRDDPTTTPLDPQTSGRQIPVQ